MHAPIIPRDIPDNFVLFFGPYSGKTYAEIKVLNPEYAVGLQVILADKNFDCYFIQT